MYSHPYANWERHLLYEQDDLECVFKSELLYFEQSRMYPPGYRKESPMIAAEEFAKELRELAAKAPPTILKMPSNTVGLPEGSFIPQTLLLYIAYCLDGQPM